MKKTKQFLKTSLSIVLVLAMFAGVFPANALLRADASTGQNKGTTKNIYDYTEDFSGVQGENGWYYNSASNAEFGAANTSKYNETAEVWTSASGGANHYGRDSFTLSLAYSPTAVMFEAPKSGTIHIEQKFTMTSTNTAAILKYAIYQVKANSTGTVATDDFVKSIYPEGTHTGINMQNGQSDYTTYAQGATVDISVEVEVEAGQRIIFSMAKNTTGAVYNIAIDTFKITYAEEEQDVEKSVYDYTEDFSGVQGENGWYYNSASNAEFGAANTSKYNETAEVWTSASGGANHYGRDSFTLSLAYSPTAVMFEAPKSGTIHIEQKFTMTSTNTAAILKYAIYQVKANSTGTVATDDFVKSIYPEGTHTGINMQNGQSDYTTYAQGATADISVEVEVEAGQRIIFSMAKNTTGAVYNIAIDTFEITYAEEEQDVEKSVYDYTEDFSGVQGENGWYYNSASNAEFGAANTSKYNETAEVWTSASGGANHYGRDSFTLSLAYSPTAVMFEAPKSGTIHIEQKFIMTSTNTAAILKYAIYQVKANSTGTVATDDFVKSIYPEGTHTGINMQNGQSDYTTYAQGATADISVEVEVEAGQRIIFSMAKNTTGAVYNIAIDTFKITYVDPEQGGGEGEGDGDEGYTPDLNKNEYDYKVDFSGTQGNESWYYSPYYNNNFGSTNQAKYNGSDNTGYWAQQGGLGTKMTKDSFTFTDYAPGGIMFVAPKDGTLQIEQDLSISNVAKDKYIKYSIYHVEADSTDVLTEEDVIKSVYPKSDTKLGFTFNSSSSTYKLYSDGERDIINKGVEVKAGEKIVFQMVSNGGAGPVIDINTFKISYVDNWVEPPSYEHTADFSKTQQGPVWYYMSAEVGKNYFKELDHYNTIRQRWQTALEETYITGAIGDHYIAPWVSHDATLAFKAPYTGTIKLKLSNAYVYSKSKDGVKLSIQKGVEGFATENLYPSGDLTTWKDVKPGDAKLSVEQTVDVRKGEWIFFRVNANVTYTGDNFYVNPSIQYLSVDESDEGIQALPDSSYIEEKEHTVPGHNMDATAFPMAGRTYSGSYTDITAAEFATKLKAGELTAGGYNITDNVLTFDDTFSGKEINASGFFVKTSKGVKLDEVEGLRVKELTVEVTGDTEALITTNSIRDVRLLGWQVSYSGSDSDVELVKTTGTASAGTKADLVIDGLRFTGDGTVKGIKFTDAVHYATLKNSYIIGVKDYVVTDSGSSTEGIYVGNCYLEGDVDINKESGVVRNNTIKGNIEITEDFGMAAMNDVTGNITAKTAQSVFLVKNKVAGKMTIENGKAFAIVENEATEITVTGGEKCIVEDNNGAGQDNKPVSSVKVDKDGTDHYGSNVYDQSVRNAVGVNEDLLPKNDNTLFVGRERKSYVNDGGNIKPVSEYVLENAVNGADVLLAPGAYSISGLKMTEKENLDLYFYCSLFEAPTSRTSYFNFMFTNSKYSSIRGMTAGYAEPALGQGTIVEVTNNYFVVESHPGYYPDLTINDHYIDNFYCLTYREGSTTPSGYQNYGGKREYLGDGKTKFELTEELEDVKVGDIFACRVQGNRYMQYWDNTECLMEDVTAYVSVEAFAGDERGNKNYYNRPAAIPGFGYEVSETDAKFDYWKSKGWITEYEGKYYGPEAIWCISNFMNANENTVGPQVTNYRANQRHDDAFNIHGVYCAVTNFDPATKTLTYDNSASDFGTWMRNIQVGDELFIYFPATGEILCETTATSATTDHGTYRTVQVADSFETRLGAIIINNSAIGNGFVYDNCELKMSYPRGGVVKAGGTFKYCTFENIGKAAIMASPEIVDTSFCESGYVNGLNLLYNDIKNTNLMHALTDKNSAISIYGHSENIDSGYAKHRDITIQGNRFENWGAHAIYIDSAENVKILDNIFVDAAAYGDERTPIYLAGSKNVEVSGNKFPSQYSGKEAVQIGGVNVKNVYGQDVGNVKCVADYVKVDSRSVYASDKWMIMIAVTNVSDANISIGLDKIRCSLVETAARQADNVAPGETAKFYFPLKEMKEIPATANFVYDLMINNDPELKLKNAKAEHVVFNILPNGKMNEGRWQTAVNESAGIEYDFNFWYDDENLYLKVIAKDDVHYQDVDAQAEEDLEKIFYQDSIEFSVDPGRAKGNGAEGWSHFGVALNNAGEVLKYRWENTLSAEDVSLMDAVVTRDEAAKTTTYDIKVPWKLTGVNGKAPEEGDIVGLSICVDDVDSASDEREYMKWYDIKSISNQAGFYIQKTAIKAYNISVGNNNVSVSTPVALKGDKVYVTYKETAEMGLENWMINTENVVLNGNYATITVGDSDIIVNVSEAAKATTKQEENKKKTSANKKEEASDEASGIVSIARVIKTGKDTVSEIISGGVAWLKDYYYLLLRCGILTTIAAAFMMIASGVLLFMLMRKKKRSNAETE